MKAAYKTTFLIFTGVILLSACQSNNVSQDNTDYVPAVSTRTKLQPTKYVPVPMPGQFMSLTKGKKKERLVGEAATAAANEKAIKQATSGKYINSIMTFDYMPGALYQIYSAPLNVTDIQFQNNEHIVAVGAGDTMRWQVSKTYSGVGANRQEHLLVKPVEEDLTNNLVVTTDRRTYHLKLKSTPETYMASVAWRYPEEDENLITNLNEDPEGSIDLMSTVDVNRLNFNYEVNLLKKGTYPDWFPRMVFNDGAKTYIRFSSVAQEAPTLFIGTAKNSQMANYRVQGNYYVVDSIFSQAQLRGGLNNNVVVQITMKK